MRQWFFRFLFSGLKEKTELSNISYSHESNLNVEKILVIQR